MRAVHVPLFLAAAAVGAFALASSMIAKDTSPVHAAAQRPVVVVGAAAPPDAHIIERPGLYGLGTEPANSRYAIVGASLVRIDAATRVVRAVIRPQVRPLD